MSLKMFSLFLHALPEKKWDVSYTDADPVWIPGSGFRITLKFVVMELWINIKWIQS